jgi:uncharacterized protein with NRDE domain
MCVIFFSYKQIPEYPLILLANRDEFYERPTAKADYWEDFPHILAGRDLVGHGTWLGVTKTGRFSAVTNYRNPDQKRGTISRGNLVADFLKTETPLKEYLQNIEANSDKYTGFNLLIGEINFGKNELFYYSNQENKSRKLEKGLYGLSNHLLDTPWRKVKKGKFVLAELLKNREFSKEKFFELLSDKTLANDEDLPDTGIGYQREKLLSSIFIETPIYGTRCSTILTFDNNFEIDFEERVFV